ncbi:MAG: hypothetical protein IJF46_02910, partial [Bacteroidaceae bacterium]|nr:hypothetical protein [Bacteroidaceae bacterium]
MTKTDLFIELAHPDKDGKSRWVYTKEFIGKYAELQLGNGGSWCRASSSLAKKYITSNPQPIGFSGILLAKRQNSFYCTYFLHNRNVADTKSPYPIKRLEV